jgi:hypothetical protein
MNVGSVAIALFTLVGPSPTLYLHSLIRFSRILGDCVVYIYLCLVVEAYDVSRHTHHQYDIIMAIRLSLRHHLHFEPKEPSTPLLSPDSSKKFQSHPRH